MLCQLSCEEKPKDKSSEEEGSLCSFMVRLLSDIPTETVTSSVGYGILCTYYNTTTFFVQLSILRYLLSECSKNAVRAFWRDRINAPDSVDFCE